MYSFNGKSWLWNCKNASFTPRIGIVLLKNLHFIPNDITLPLSRFSGRSDNYLMKQMTGIRNIKQKKRKMKWVRMRKQHTTLITLILAWTFPDFFHLINLVHPIFQCLDQILAIWIGHICPLFLTCHSNQVICHILKKDTMMMWSPNLVEIQLERMK